VSDLTGNLMHLSNKNMTKAYQQTSVNNQANDSEM